MTAGCAGGTHTVAGSEGAGAVSVLTRGDGGTTKVFLSGSFRSDVGASGRGLSAATILSTSDLLLCRADVSTAA